MVAAGVYLVGRFYPVFTPEVLLVIAIIGCITLFLAATIAITAIDIKRVLAYSTVSQLGYMMLALGVGGWVAGLFHLITHAFFKSLLFLCSGSVIHAVHTNDMPQMGGLRKKMPITAYTMLVGCLAIAGAGVPFVDRLQRLLLEGRDPRAGAVVLADAIGRRSRACSSCWPSRGAAITAFYMFRLWFMTFAGEPRDHHRYDHAHESPRVMYGAAGAAGGVRRVRRLELARHVCTGRAGELRRRRTCWSKRGRSARARARARRAAAPTLASQRARSHMRRIHVPATLVAIGTALAGLPAGRRCSTAADARPGRSAPRSSRRSIAFLCNKWYFDELYDVAVRAAGAVRLAAASPRSTRR